MKKFLTVTTAALLAVSALAQPALRSGKPIMSADEKGLAPLGVTQAIATRPIGIAYVSAESASPSLFLMVRSGVPTARGIFYSTMEGTEKAGGRFVFSPPAKLKPYWGKPSNMPSYGCVFQFKGRVFSYWAEENASLALASFNPETREVTKVASVPFEGLEGIHYLSAIEGPGGTLELTALVNDGSKYRVDRQKDESWYDGAHIYKGAIARGGVRRAVVKDLLKGGRFEEAVPQDFMISPTGTVRIKDDFLGADGYLVVNRFGSVLWSDKSGKHYVRDGAGKQIRYHAIGPSAVALCLRSGETVVFMGGEGSISSCSFEGMGQDGPLFSGLRTVLQSKGALYTGSLGVPEVVDWDDDGLLDVVCGNSEGRILFFRNTGSNVAPRFSGFPEELRCEGEPICIRPGYIGVQGPFEAVWGYMCPAVFDWNGDSRPDIVFSDSRGKLEVMLRRPDGDLARPFSLKEDGLEIHGLWRVKPAVTTIGGRICVVNLDGDGALHRWWKTDEDSLEDGGTLLHVDGKPITTYTAKADRDGSLGRVKINLYDWDGDGDLDLILGTPGQTCLPHPEKGIPNGKVLKQQMMQVFFLENKGSDAKPRFADPVGFYVNGEDLPLGGHANAPVPCMLGDISLGANLLVGCESGRLMWISRGDLTTFTIKDRYDKR